MIATIGQIMQQAGHALRFGGIVLTMYDHSLELMRGGDREVRDFFGEFGKMLNLTFGTKALTNQ